MKRLIRKTIIEQEVPLEFEAEAGRFGLYIGDVESRRIAEETHKFCYWRMVGKDNRDLVSMDIDRTSGEIFAISLLAYHRPISQMTCDQPLSDLQIGTPILDLSMFKPTSYSGFPETGSDLVDVFEDFILEFGVDKLRLAFFDDPISERIKVNQRLVIEFNEAVELCSIIVTDLSNEELRLISWKPA